MMTRLLLVPGWAHPPAALQPLTDLLRNVAEVTCTDSLSGADGQWIAGWSLGGLRALRAVAAGTCRPAGLILISSCARFCGAADYPCGLPEGQLRVMMRQFDRQPEATLADFFRRCAHPSSAGDTDIARRLAETPSEPLREGLADLRDIDLRDQLDIAPPPLLLLHGEQDAVIPCDASQWLHLRLPASVLKLHPTAGHDLPLRHADWVAGHIAAFMKDGSA